MNKKLLTAAIGAALAAAPMFAANAAPTVYGKMNVGVASIDNGNDSTATQDSSSLVMTDDASRLGVKGEEDLGGGMKALYLWETTIDVDNGGLLGGRDAYVGLGGGWGSLRLGQYNTAYKLVSVPTEIFGDTIGDFTGSNKAGETRQANNIGYTSPSFGGLKVALEYANHNETGQTDTGASPEITRMNGSVTWSSGPIYVGVGYYDFGPVSGANALDTAMQVSAQWKSGPLRIAATYEDQKGQGNTTVFDNLNLAGSFAMGNHEFALSYTMVSCDASGTATCTNADATMMALGYFYNFSKSTALKVVYATIDNDANSAQMGRMSSGAASHSLPATAAGKDPSGLQVQISTSF